MTERLNSGAFDATNRLWDIVDFSWVKGLFKAWVTAALISTATTTLAQESTSIEDAYNAWCNQNAQLCSKTSANLPKIDGYDASSNSFVVWENTSVVLGKAQPSPKIVEKNASLFSSAFDVDNSWDVGVNDIEKKFSVTLSEFNSLYKWDTLFYELNSEIQSLLSNYDSLMAKRAQLVDESEIKKADKEILSVLKEIERKKMKIYVDFFENLKSKVNQVLQNDTQKILFLSYLNTQNEEVQNFYNFVLSTLTQSTINNQASHSENGAYVSQELSKTLAKTDSDVNASLFSSQQLLRYSLEFTKLRDVHNMKVLATWLNESNMFEFLSDINNDGVVSKEDKWVLYGAQLLSLLNDTQKQLDVEANDAKLYTNIGYILQFWGFTGQVKNKADLLQVLQNNPEVKLQFLEWVNFLNLSGIDVAYALKYGSSGVKLWNDAKEKMFNHPLVGKLVMKMKDKMLNISTELTKIKAAGVITDKEYAQMMAKVESTVNKPWFDEVIFNQVVGMLSALSATYFSESGSLNGAKFSYSKNIFNAQNEKIIKKFVDKLELDLGVVNTASGNMLMLGLAYKVDNNISESEKLSYGFWARFWLGSINNVLPVLTLGYTKITNLEEVKEAGIENFELSKNSFTLSGNYSMLNVNGMNLWFFAGYKNDRQWALETKFEQYSQLLDKLFDYDGKMSLETFCEWLERKVNTPEMKKVNFVANSILNVANILQSSDFNSLSTAEKRRNIQVVKMQLLSKFLSYYASKEEEKGYGVSGFGLSLNILMKVATGGFPLLPWVEFSKMTYDYDMDQGKKTLSEMMKDTSSGEKIDFSKDQTKFLSNLDKYINVKWVNVSYKDGQIQISSEKEWNVFDVLEKSGVHIFINPAQKVSSQISFQNNTIILWDIQTLSTYNDTSKDGKTVIIVIGWENAANKLRLTSQSVEILSNNIPSSVTQLQFSHRNMSLQNTGVLNTKKIGIFM